MTSAAYPTVYAALLAAVDAALSCRVVDGFDVSSEPGDVVYLGLPDIREANAIRSGSFAQAVGPMGSARPRDEDGTINGLVWAWNGDGDAAAARTSAFGYLASIEAALRADPAIGVTAFQRLVVQLSAGEVVEDKELGANCALPVTFTYAARI